MVLIFQVGLEGVSMIRIAHVVVVAGLALSVLVIPQGASADFTVIHTFLGGDDGEYPLGGLTIGGRGKLLGTTFGALRSEEHTSELQSRFGISYAVFCLKKKK